MHYYNKTRSDPFFKWQRIFGELGMEKDSVRDRKEFRKGLEKRWVMESGQGNWAQIRRGWCFGSEGFKEKLLEKWADLTEEKQTDNWSGELVDQTEEQRAEELYKRGVQVLQQAGHGWVEMDTSRKRADWKRVWMAWWIYTQSRVGLKWVAKRIGMGDPSGVSHACRRIGERAQRDKVLRKLCEHANKSNFKD